MDLFQSRDQSRRVRPSAERVHARARPRRHPLHQRLTSRQIRCTTSSRRRPRATTRSNADGLPPPHPRIYSRRQRIVGVRRRTCEDGLTPAINELMPRHRRHRFSLRYSASPTTLRSKGPRLRLLPARRHVISVSAPMGLIKLRKPPKRRRSMRHEVANNTHHLLYRTEWCTTFHEEWKASMHAEATAGPNAGWLRSIPFGPGPLLPRRVVSPRYPKADYLPTSGQSYSAIAARLLPPRQAARRFSPSSTLPTLLNRSTKSPTLLLLIYRCTGQVSLDTCSKAGAKVCRRQAVSPFHRPRGSQSRCARLWPLRVLFLLTLTLFSLCMRAAPSFVHLHPRATRRAVGGLPYAAIEAGSIPIVVRNSTYKGCHDPSVRDGTFHTLCRELGGAAWLVEAADGQS